MTVQRFRLVLDVERVADIPVLEWYLHLTIMLTMFTDNFVWDDQPGRVVTSGEVSSVKGVLTLRAVTAIAVGDWAMVDVTYAELCALLSRAEKLYVIMRTHAGIDAVGDIP